MQDDYLTKQGWVRSKRQIIAKAREVTQEGTNLNTGTIAYLIAELFSDTTEQILKELRYNG